MAAGKGKRSKNAGSDKISLPSRLLLFVNLVCIFLMLLSLLASYISPAKFWPLAFAGISYPILLFVNLFFVLFWMVFLKKYFVLSLLAIAMGYNHLNSFVQLRNSPEIITAGDAIRVMSYNVRLFDIYNWKNQKQTTQSREDIFRLIHDQSPDILCLQEYYSGRRSSVNFADTILGFGNCRYYYAAFIDNGKKELPFGLATFSKYPILGRQKINFHNSYENYCLITDLDAPGGRIRVINTHLESVKFGKEDYVFVNELSNNAANNKEITHGSKAIFSKMLSAFRKRAEQADQLASIISQSPYPVMVCADFNDTPASYAYRQVASTHTDSFTAAGTGLGQTYSQLLPILRIDYIFVDKKMKVIDYKTIHKEYSDHYPIIATISTHQ